jgi:hypothetical protein
MYYGIVIDAHLMSGMRDELARSSGQLFGLINWFLQNCGIAMTPIIEAHWKSKIRDTDPVFWSWYYTQIEGKTIRSVEPKDLGTNVKKKLRVEYCVPKDPYVKGYLECAHATNGPRYIITEDIYLYDPKAGSKATKTQAKIKQNRDGVLCRYLETQLKIRIGPIADCISHFCVHEAVCSNKVAENNCQCHKVS